MSDVRLTATNPVDSSVVPVACNDKGELLVDINGNIIGDLSVSGTGQFAGEVTAGSGSTFYGVVGITGGGDANDYAAFYGACLDPSGRVFIGSDVSGGGNNITSKIFASGNAEFSGEVTVGTNPNQSGAPAGIQLRDRGQVIASRGAVEPVWTGYTSGNTAYTSIIFGSGNAEFAGDVVVGSRGSKWKIVESGGIAHLIQETALMADEASDDPAPDDQDIEGGSEPVYPELRNLPRELDLIEQALAEVMEKLRMTPPAGFPVWDGSDENS